MAFPTKAVVRVTGVNEKTLHYWDKIGLVRPSVQRGSGRGSRKLYSFRDMVAIDAALKLKRAGLDGDGLRRLVNFVKRRSGIKEVGGDWVAAGARRAVQVAPEDLRRALGRGGERYAFLLDLPQVVEDVATRVQSLSAEVA